MPCKCRNADPSSSIPAGGDGCTVRRAEPAEGGPGHREALRRGLLAVPRPGRRALLLLLPPNVVPDDPPASETPAHEVEAGRAGELKFPIPEEQPARKDIRHGYL